MMANSSHFEDSRDEQAKNRAEEESSPVNSETLPLRSFRQRTAAPFLQGAAAAAAALAMPRWAHARPSDLDAIHARNRKAPHESVKRLQDWIRQPSIAAEKPRPERRLRVTMRMLREAGFQLAAKGPHRRPARHLRHAGCRAPRTLGLYYMYDVKQADPPNGLRRHSKPLWLINPASEKVVMGRGAR